VGGKCIHSFRVLVAMKAGIQKIIQQVKQAAGNVAQIQKNFTITQHGGITSKFGLTRTPSIAAVVKLHQEERVYGKFVETLVMIPQHRVAVLIDQCTRENLAAV
jgi:hypothetical protein